MLKDKTIILLCLLMSCAHLWAAGDTTRKDVELWLQKLDESLALSPKYEAEHNNRINDLKKLVTGRESLGTRFEIYQRIYLAYQSYRADSAIAYASRCMDLARQMHNDDYMVLAKCNMAFVCTNSGDNIKSFKLLSSIDPHNLPLWLKTEYYKTLFKQWIEQKNYVVSYEPAQDEYAKWAEQCADTIIALSKPHSPDWYRYSISKASLVGDQDRVITLAEQALKTERDKHRRANYYMEAAWAYKIKGDANKGTVFFIKSAICDNESVTREITSLYNVGSEIQHYDDARASLYVSKALDYINFYNARIRLMAMSNIMPIVEHTHLEVVKQQRDIFVTVTLLVLVMVLALGCAYLYTRRLNRRLREAQRLSAAHLKNLNIANDRLTEADKVKSEYIGRTLYDASEYIDSLEHIFNKINKAVVTRRYGDIEEVASQEFLNNERKTMFRNFDQTFLALFPHFVQQYNALFAEADRKYPAEEGTLTSEMRIFALIRMGIRESERIARYLGYSVHTVNTYKTRAKNRSQVNNEDFETRIMAI